MDANKDRPFLRDFSSIGEFHDFWTSVTFKAPSDLHYSFLSTRVDQKQALLDAFDSLKRGLDLVTKKVADERTMGVLHALLEMARGYFQANDRKLALQCMQEAEGLIWKSQSIRLERAADAERLAFGDVQKFKDLPARRYDGEGTLETLGPGQRSLWDEAHKRALGHLKTQEQFKPFTLALNRAGEIFQLNRPSRKKTNEELKRLAEAGEIVAFSRTELVLLGILIHDFEEKEQPQVSARAQVKDYQLQAFRFFLDDPTIF